MILYQQEQQQLLSLRNWKLVLIELFQPYFGAIIITIFKLIPFELRQEEAQLGDLVAFSYACNQVMSPSQHSRIIILVSDQ